MINTNLTLDKIAQILVLSGFSWYISGILSFVGLFNFWLGWFTLSIGFGLAYLAMANPKLEPVGRAVLVTGCDSGFGHALALHLLDLGFTVFAGCLLADKGGEGAESLKKMESPNLRVIQLNVTSEEEVKTARKKVEELMPKGVSLWGVVNNAGMATFGDMEWIPLSTYKRVSEVNVFGTISVTKAFLPLIRKSKGRVVNVASMLGRMGVPMRSPYVLTKYAVEGMSDCLRHEMKPWGVDVIIIEPGNFIAGTNIFTEESVTKQAEEMWGTMSQEIKEGYGEEFFKSRVEIMKSYVTGGSTDLSPVMLSFEEALTQKFPQARYQPMDLYYKTRIFVATHFPEWIYDTFFVGCLNK